MILFSPQDTDTTATDLLAEEAAAAAADGPAAETAILLEEITEVAGDEAGR